ncbi:uncharacterized protein Fot_22205 [Forsythia ovata]|uniref:Uncharacterized protein n=1 Tax=Forsythia ovata TaxID=205694 RepID=A0ABD1UX24_9LAMI
MSEDNDEDNGDNGCLNDWEVVADDAFRLRACPSLSKQYSFLLNLERHFGRGAFAWGCKIVRPVPTPCPICCEDLDFTDSMFISCLCGFQALIMGWWILGVLVNFRFWGLI